MPFYICSKLFHHAHNFEYTLQWAVHNPYINWLCEAVTLERKLKTKILSFSICAYYYTRNKKTLDIYAILHYKTVCKVFVSIIVEVYIIGKYEP